MANFTSPDLKFDICHFKFRVQRGHGGKKVPGQGKNIFADIPKAHAREHFLTLFESATVKIERIISHVHSSPPGFWYDQSDDEWVLVLRGHAILEFESGESIRMKRGDHFLIPSHIKHRVNRTGPETIWLAVHIKP